MGIDGKIKRSIPGVEGEVYKRTGISSTRFRFKKMRMEVNILDYAAYRILSIEYEDKR